MPGLVEIGSQWDHDKRLHFVTCCLSNLSHNCYGLATIVKSKSLVYNNCYDIRIDCKLKSKIATWIVFAMDLSHNLGHFLGHQV